MKILLHEVLQERNLSVREAEKITGVSKSNICSIINGKSYPNILTLERLARGLEVRITDLIQSEYL